MSIHDESASGPLFAPAAFAAMAILVLHEKVPLASLAEQLPQGPAELAQTLRELTAMGYVEAIEDTICATANGRNAFDRQFAWLERRMSDRE
jgi:hypothetical protein